MIHFSCSAFVTRSCQNLTQNIHISCADSQSRSAQHKSAGSWMNQPGHIKCQCACTKAARQLLSISLTMNFSARCVCACSLYCPCCSSKAYVRVIHLIAMCPGSLCVTLCSCNVLCLQHKWIWAPSAPTSPFLPPTIPSSWVDQPVLQDWGWSAQASGGRVWLLYIPIKYAWESDTGRGGRLTGRLGVYLHVHMVHVHVHVQIYTHEQSCSKVNVPWRGDGDANWND